MEDKLERRTGWGLEMKKLSVRVAALLMFVLCFVAGSVLSAQRKAQARGTTEIAKRLPSVARPARLPYVNVASRAALLQIQSLFSDINRVTKGNGAATAETMTGTVSCAVIDDGNSAAVAGFWGNGLANTGSTTITGAAGLATVQLTQLIGEAELWMVVFEEGSGYVVPPCLIPINSPGSYTIHSPAFSMQPGKKYSIVSYLFVPALANLNATPIHPNPTHTAMALSGKFETIKFTIS